MANLSGVNLDPGVEESAGDGDFPLLPAGKYKAVIVRDELRDNNAGNGKLLELKLQVVDGQYTGTTLPGFINITNPSAQCQAIGQGTLKRICTLCGVKYPPAKTEGLHGKPMVVTVIQSDFISNTSGKKLKSNKAIAYESVDTETGPTEEQPPLNTGQGAW